MKKIFSTIAIAFAMIAGGNVAVAADAPALPIENPDPTPVGVDESGQPIYRLIDIPDLPEGSMIYRGTRSVEGEFPAMGWIGNCTATAVAPNAIVTAAHCQNNGAVIYFQHRQSAKSYRAVCTRHPQYNAQTLYNDFVLCKLDQNLPEGSILATLADFTPSAGSKVLLNGYGQPNPRVHFWGYSQIRSFSGQDLITCGNPSNLGPGDSGGGLLAWNEDRTFRKSPAYIVAINSRGNGQCDWYNMVANTSFRNFASQWAQTHNVRMCGINTDCTAHQPSPPDEQPNCNNEVAILNSLQQSMADAVEKVSACVVR